MATEFLERRHERPDYEVDLQITGVKLGNTGKVHWKIYRDEEMDPELLAEILDRVAEVLRRG